MCVQYSNARPHRNHLHSEYCDSSAAMLGNTAITCTVSTVTAVRQCKATPQSLSQWVLWQQCGNARQHRNHFHSEYCDSSAAMQGNTAITFTVSTVTAVRQCKATPQSLSQWVLWQQCGNARQHRNHFHSEYCDSSAAMQGNTAITFTVSTVTAVRQC